LLSKKESYPTIFLSSNCHLSFTGSNGIIIPSKR
jgi:hypothetical protein